MPRWLDEHPQRVLSSDIANKLQSEAEEAVMKHTGTGKYVQRQTERLLSDFQDRLFRYIDDVIDDILDEEEVEQRESTQKDSLSTRPQPNANSPERAAPVPSSSRQPLNHPEHPLPPRPTFTSEERPSSHNAPTVRSIPSSSDPSSRTERRDDTRESVQTHQTNSPRDHTDANRSQRFPSENRWVDSAISGKPQSEKHDLNVLDHTSSKSLLRESQQASSPWSDRDSKHNESRGSPNEQPSKWKKASTGALPLPSASLPKKPVQYLSTVRGSSEPRGPAENTSSRSRDASSYKRPRSPSVDRYASRSPHRFADKDDDRRRRMWSPRSEDEHFRNVRPGSEKNDFQARRSGRDERQRWSRSPSPRGDKHASTSRSSDYYRSNHRPRSRSRSPGQHSPRGQNHQERSQDLSSSTMKRRRVSRWGD